MHDLFCAGRRLALPNPSLPAHRRTSKPEQVRGSGVRNHPLSAFALIVAAACDDPPMPIRAQDDADNCSADGWEECEQEPDPFSSPAPPVGPTAVAGTYTRNISEQLAWAAGKMPSVSSWPPRAGRGKLRVRLRPFPCKSPSARIAEQGTRHGIRSSGGSLNAANCIGFEAIYNRTIENGRLYLDAVEDECPFTNLRQRFLMAKVWNVDQPD